MLDVGCAKGVDRTEDDKLVQEVYQDISADINACGVDGKVQEPPVLHLE